MDEQIRIDVLVAARVALNNLDDTAGLAMLDRDYPVIVELGEWPGDAK